MNIVLLEFLKGIGERKHILSDVMTELQYLLLGVQYVSQCTGCRGCSGR